MSSNFKVLIYITLFVSFFIVPYFVSENGGDKILPQTQYIETSCLVTKIDRRTEICEKPGKNKIRYECIIAKIEMTYLDRSNNSHIDIYEGINVNTEVGDRRTCYYDSNNPDRLGIPDTNYAIVLIYFLFLCGYVMIAILVYYCKYPKASIKTSIQNDNLTIV